MDEEKKTSGTITDINVGANTDTDRVVATITKTSPSEARQKLLDTAVNMMDSMTQKKSIKDKLTSRKFWVSLAGLVVGIIGIIGFNISDNMVGLISSSIVSLGSVVGYLLSEGTVDANSIREIMNIINKIIDEIDKMDNVATTTTTVTGTTGDEVAAAVYRIQAESEKYQAIDKAIEETLSKNEAAPTPEEVSVPVAVDDSNPV